MTHFSKRNFIVLALLAMASPTWAQPTGERDICSEPGKCRVYGTEHLVEHPDIPIKACWPTCIAGGGPALSSPKCDPGYALLAYPGTWTLVCARDLQAPQ